MKKIAVISAILEHPSKTQAQFNEIISEYSNIVRGRMGIPFEAEGIAAICITVVAPLDKINSLTGKLGSLPDVMVKTAISKKEIA